MEKYNLKIGDWVTYTASDGQKKADKVSAIREGDMINTESQFWPFTSESLEPIPLTEEIVLKNQDKWTSILTVRAVGDNKDLGLTDWMVNVGNPYWKLDIRLIHFVHELQHIIWAFGMDDRLKL